jgi:hypothetical protein
MADCMANENSWHLSENFERNCKERCQMNIEEEFEFSLDMKSDSDADCKACHIKANNNKKEQLACHYDNIDQNDTIVTNNSDNK